MVKLWDTYDLKRAFFEFNAKSEVNDIKFNPNNQWVAAATDKGA